MNVFSPVLSIYLAKTVGLFVTLYFVFTLEPRWGSCVSTLGGALLFCVGVKSGRFAVRQFGLLCQCIGLYLFLDTVWYPFRAPILFNSYFLGTCIIAFSAFVSAYYLETIPTSHFKRDNWTILLLVFLGTVTWYVGGLREVYMHVVLHEQLNGVLLFIVATSIIAGTIGEKIYWQRLYYLLLFQLPVTLCILIFELLTGPEDYSLMTGWGTIIWPITFFIQYRLLTIFDGLEWPKLRVSYHLISLWMILFVCCREFILRALKSQNIGNLSAFVSTACLTLVWIFLVQFMAQKKYWPVVCFPKLYLWGGGTAVVLFMSGWFVQLIL